MPEHKAPSHLTPGYLEYLRSAHWWNLKRDLWRMRGRKCTACQSADTVDPHHLIYRIPFTDGKVTDLMPLCRRCHNLVHEWHVPAMFADNVPVCERWKRTEAFLRRRLDELERWAKLPTPQVRNGWRHDPSPKRKGRWQDYAAWQREVMAFDDKRRSDADIARRDRERQAEKERERITRLEAEARQISRQRDISAEKRYRAINKLFGGDIPRLVIYR